LDQPGDYSEPIRTNIGWHVIQLIEKKPMPEFDALKKEIKSKVKRDSRSQIGAKKFVNTLKRNYEFSVSERNLYKSASQLVDVQHVCSWRLGRTKFENRPQCSYLCRSKTYAKAQSWNFWSKESKAQMQSEDAIEEYLAIALSMW